MADAPSIVILSASFFVDVAAVDDARPPHVLICIHGIRDDGAWCNSTATALGDFLDSKIEIICVRYDRVSSYGFILGRNRDAIKLDVIDQINFVKRSFPESPISVLAHSNGTKVLAEIIPDLDFELEWIFLCGSVCHIRDVNNLRKVSRVPVNDVGTKDWWPIIAEALRPSMFGATGTNGFYRFPVKDRFFAYYHGQGTNEEHIQNWILPTLATGRVRNTAAINFRTKKHAATYIRYSLIMLPVLTPPALFLIPFWITAVVLSVGWTLVLTHILRQRWASHGP
jgi:hypothetical protein